MFLSKTLVEGEYGAYGDYGGVWWGGASAESESALPTWETG